MKRFLKTLVALLPLLTVFACVEGQDAIFPTSQGAQLRRAQALERKLDSGIAKYNAVAETVQLGDFRNKVLSILDPTQEGIPQLNRKNPDKYIKDNVLVEIYYFRTGRQPDGLTTDDEFTPYLFNDGKLVAIGWRVLGGPKSVGQVIQPAPVTNVKPTTIVKPTTGMSFMCKSAISRGDSGGTFIFC